MPTSSQKLNPDALPASDGWHQLSPGGVAEKLSVDTEWGLSEDAVDGSRQLHGDNKLTEHKQLGIAGRFFKQFKSPLVLILLLAGIITLVIGHGIDATVIFVALGINVIIGTVQEGRASSAFQALEKSQSKEATVIREGSKQVIPAEDVVVGDIVELDSGMYVPADMRLIKEKNLQINEAALTGEWMGVDKNTEKITDSDTPIPDRVNMAYKGTLVDSGEGRGIVVAVGDQTEVGKIAQDLTAGSENTTPIQRHMERLARLVAIISVLAVVVIFALGVIRGEELIQMLVFSIAVAVSVVPEGMPAAVTVVLALGMENILKRGGLVKNLRAAETLGSTTVILTDKTGTLTQAKMQVADLLSFDQIEDDGDADNQEAVLSPLQLHLLEGAVTSSDAFVESSSDGPVVRGRPIEKALVTCGLEAELDKTAIDERRRDFMAFSSENRYAASLSAAKAGDETDNNELFVSGAPEFVLSHASRISTTDGLQEIDDSLRTQIKDLQDQKSAEGKRVIAIAYKPNEGKEIARAEEGRASSDQISNLIFLGLISFADPIREDVADSIQKARDAGAHVVMATGDNPETAGYIAKQAGIVEGDPDPVVGPELDNMSDEEIVEAVTTRTVFARVLPKQKLRIAQLLHDRDEVVAMTGDGVNDAPALRAADIGVSVGSGTEVAKEASDLVLLDDSFSIIVAAIEEGRRIIDNLKKIIAHLLSTSFGGLFLIGGALVVGLPIPILTPQILWVNIVEGGLLTFVFAAEPPAGDVMKRNPREARTKNLISTPMKWLVAISGTITGIAAFVIYVILNGQGIPLETVRTIMFVILTIDALFFVVALKDFYKPIYNIDFSNNKFLFISLGLSLAALFGAIFIPGLRELLSLTLLSGQQWLFLLGVGIFDLTVVEVAKYALFQRPEKESA